MVGTGQKQQPARTMHLSSVGWDWPVDESGQGWGAGVTAALQRCMVLLLTLASHCSLAPCKRSSRHTGSRLLDTAQAAARRQSWQVVRLPARSSTHVQQARGKQSQVLGEGVRLGRGPTAQLCICDRCESCSTPAASAQL